MSWMLVATITVAVDGSPLSDEVLDELTTATVEQSLAMPDTFTLEFRDPNRSILTDSGIEVGSIVDIEVQTPDFAIPEPLIEKAEVTGLEVEFTSDGTLTIVRGMDKSFRAWSGGTVASYKNSTISDAVKTVAQRAGLALGNITSTTKVYENLTQNNLSDWGFIRSLADELGFDAWVTAGELNFGPRKSSTEDPAPGRTGSAGPLQLVAEENLISLRCALTAGSQVKDVNVRGWNPEAKEAVVGNAAAASVSATAGLNPETLARKLGNPSYLSVESPRVSADEAELAAKAIAETIGGCSAAFEGVSVGNPKLRAGDAVSLALVGDPFDGKYTLSETRHVVEDDGYTTWFAVNGRADRSLLGLAGAGSNPIGGRRIPGVVIGIVTDNKDPENQCRVKLKFPWLSDDYETDWARNVQAWAGNTYGTVIVPEVNDEVLVAFEQGDIHRPFVLGGLYNGMDKPYAGTPELIGSDGKVNRRDLVSRTGHLLSMTELEGQNDGILIKTAGGGYKVELSKQAKTVTIEADGTVTIEAKGTGAMAIKAAGNLDISARQISVKAQNGISIDGGAGAVDIKSVSKVGVQAAQVDVMGNGTAALKSGGVVTVQGSLVKIN